MRPKIRKVWAWIYCAGFFCSTINFENVQAWYKVKDALHKLNQKQDLMLRQSFLMDTFNGQLKLCRHQCVWKWEKLGLVEAGRQQKRSWVVPSYSLSQIVQQHQHHAVTKTFFPRKLPLILSWIYFLLVISCKGFRNRKLWPKLISLGSFSCEVSAVHTWWDRG